MIDTTKADRWVLFLQAAAQRDGERSVESAALHADFMELEFQKRFGDDAILVDGIQHCHSCENEVARGLRGDFAVSRLVDGTFVKVCSACLEATMEKLPKEETPAPPSTSVEPIGTVVSDSIVPPPGRAPSGDQCPECHGGENGWGHTQGCPIRIEEEKMPCLVIKPATGQQCKLAKNHIEPHEFHDIYLKCTCSHANSMHDKGFGKCNGVVTMAFSKKMPCSCVKFNHA